MGKARYLYNNLITEESMLSVSSLRYGLVTRALKEGSGSATMNPAGSYTGTVDLEYTIEIDSISGGAEVGQATFRWSDGTGTWNASGVLTSAAAVALNNGVTVSWASGSGADFVVGDKWYFKAINLFSAGKMLDWNRDSRYRAQGLDAPNTITIDLGSAQQFNSLAIFDHNLSSGSSLLLEANTADAWGAPLFSEAITWNSEKILHYLSAAQTYRYIRISITDAGNADEYIEIGELFLGSYMEPSNNHAYGRRRSDDILLTSNISPFGVPTDRFYNYQPRWDLLYRRLSDADLALFTAMQTALANRTAGTYQPIYFNLDSATPNDTYMVKVLSFGNTNQFINQSDMPLSLQEVPRSV